MNICVITLTYSQSNAWCLGNRSFVKIMTYIHWGKRRGLAHFKTMIMIHVIFSANLSKTHASWLLHPNTFTWTIRDDGSNYMIIVYVRHKCNWNKLCTGFKVNEQETQIVRQHICCQLVNGHHMSLPFFITINEKHTQINRIWHCWMCTKGEWGKAMPSKCIHFSRWFSIVFR